jgi:integrase
VALLRTIRAGVPIDSPWVFPGDVKGNPISEIHTFWEGVRIKANLPDLRIHDLRHTFASLLVSGGMTLPMIGRLLGHTQVQTTQRYAHLFDDPLRAGLRPSRRNDSAEAATYWHGFHAIQAENG